LRQLGTGAWLTAYMRGEGPALQVVTSGLLPIGESIETSIDRSRFFP
jgi:hypothetical protein